MGMNVRSIENKNTLKYYQLQEIIRLGSYDIIILLET